MDDSTMILTLFAGIGDLFLALTLKKPKENKCVCKIVVFSEPHFLKKWTPRESSRRNDRCVLYQNRSAHLFCKIGVFPVPKSPCGHTEGK